MKVKSGIVLTLALLGAFILWLAIGKSTAAETVYPLENGARALSRAVFAPIKTLWAHPKVVRENQRLREETARQKMTLLDYDVLLRENARLRKALDFPARASGEWIAAPVLSQGGVAGVPHLLRVGKGSRAGVRAGAAVAVAEGVVGRVSAVSPHTAEVRLITDPAIQVACRATADDGRPTFGILSGTRLRHLRRDLTLSPRQPLVTSGLGGVYPPDLPVGRLVRGSEPDATLLEGEGEVIFAVDFTTLENVFIRREN